MVIADVPTPIAFAYFPMTKKLISPESFYPAIMIQITEVSLQNGGYYFALSDHYDLTILGDYYTNGSYGMRFESSYAKNAYRGNLNFRFENLITSERGYPDYSAKYLQFTMVAF
jgi:hypothetical protein